MEKLPVEEKKGDTVIYAPVIRKGWNSKIIDTVQSVAAVFIFLFVIVTYFVTFQFNLDISLKDFTLNCIWFLVGNYAIGILCKSISKSKHRSTEEYREAQGRCEKIITELSESGYSARVAEYCEQRVKNMVWKQRKHYLGYVGITPEEYTEKYLGKSKREILREYPDCRLTKSQLQAICKCNHIRVGNYNPDFLLVFEADLTQNKSPSEMFNTKKQDGLNNLTSLASGIFSALFAGSIAYDFVFNFSATLVFMVLIKVVMILINVAFKIRFGWNIALQEIKQNELRASEAKACLEWCKANPPKTKASKEESV